MLLLPWHAQLAVLRKALRTASIWLAIARQAMHMQRGLLQIRTRLLQLKAVGCCNAWALAGA